MNRRNVIAGVAATWLVAPFARGGEMQAQDMRFNWRHQDQRLWGELSAPAPGWLAVGFNDVAGLIGTRFIIASITTSGVRAEEHIAGNGTHQEVAALGGNRMLEDVSGEALNGQNMLSFSLPVAGDGPFAKPLGKGVKSYVMLAWSRAPEFEHHSAWRQHFELIL